MRRQIIFDGEARLEFEEAVIWYNARQPGLGDRFESEVHATFQRILQTRNDSGRSAFIREISTGG